ncbi:MAG: hypothetical protein JW709_11845 [Sedimentisphaerales bacterium]|nr:hypothetical protein [Sedimentisphaerales bacterium]
MHIQRWTPAVIAVGLILIWGLSTPAVAQDDAAELNLPTANEQVDNAVPYTTIQDIADMKAEANWGPAYCIAEIPCCDLNGDVVAYMFVYQYGQGPAKSYGEITTEVKQGRKEYAQAEKELAKAKRQMGKEPAPTTATTDPMTPAVVNPTPEYVKAYVKKDAARKKLFGVGKYGYMVISACYDRNPIPVTGHGLPGFFTRGDLMKSKAQAKTGLNAQLQRIYMAGASQQWFEFKSDAEQTVTVEANTLQEDGTDTIQKAMAYIAQRDAEEERQQLYAAKWQKLELAAQEVQQ